MYSESKVRVILASNSPRRKDLLTQIIKDFEIIPSNAEENCVKGTIRKSSVGGYKEDFLFAEGNSKEICVIKDPVELVEKLSIIKAEDIFNKEKSKNGDLFVIGGDTVVYLDKKIMGKPKSKEDAFSMLSKLQGRENEVYTGLGIIIRIGNKIVRELYSNKTIVKMKNMSEADILEYIATGEPMDKAGSYAVQGIGSKYIEKIEGDYNVAVGLNTEKIKDVLKKYELGIEI